MCLFDTDAVVRTMTEAMGMGEGLQAANLPWGGKPFCLLQASTTVEKEKLGSERMGCGRARSKGEQAGGPLPPAAPTSQCCKS